MSITPETREASATPRLHVPRLTVVPDRADDRILHATRFSNGAAHTTGGEPIEGTWPDIASELFGTVASAPYAAKKSLPAMVGGALRDGCRDAEHLEALDMLVLDADAQPAGSFDRVLALCRSDFGLNFALYNTFSHGLPDDPGERFRLVLPLAKPLRRMSDARRQGLGKALGRYFEIALDGCSVSWSQCAFLPAWRDGGEAPRIEGSTDGEHFDVFGALSDPSEPWYWGFEAYDPTQVAAPVDVNDPASFDGKYSERAADKVRNTVAKYRRQGATAAEGSNDAARFLLGAAKILHLVDPDVRAELISEMQRAPEAWTAHPDQAKVASKAKTAIANGLRRPDMSAHLEWEETDRAVQALSSRQAKDTTGEPIERVVDGWRVSIRTSDNEQAFNTQAMRALAQQREDIYAMTADVVEVQDGRMHHLNADGLRVALSGCIELRDGKGRLTSFPERAPKGILARASHPELRQLKGVVRVPSLLETGRVLEAAGYDEASQLFYAPTREYPSMPVAPSRQEAERALGELKEVICDFPFADEGSRSVALAAMLTPLAREAISGPVPLFLFSAPQAGTGKTLLATACGLIGTGADVPNSVPGGGQSEMRKTLLPIAQAGERVHLFDNAERGGPFGGAALDQAITASHCYSQRILGASKTWTGPFPTVFFASGNNVALAGDTVRRTAICRLVSHEERPETRTGFKRDDLIEWVRAEQPRLTAAGLTILRAYQQHRERGGQAPSMAPWAGFEAFRRVVREALLWLGCADFVPGTRPGIDAESPEHEEASELFELLSAAYPDETPILVDELYRAAEAASPGGLGLGPGTVSGTPAMQALALGVREALGRTLSRNQTGRLLAGLVDARRGDRVLRRGRQTGDLKGKRWYYIETV